MYLDNRNGVDYDIYAQHINSSGAIKWNPNGIPICTVIEVVDRHIDPNGDDDDDTEPEAIPGYNLIIFIAIIGVISIIIARKYRKQKQW